LDDKVDLINLVFRKKKPSTLIQSPPFFDKNYLN
jgi:hypothetical protein